MATLQTSYLGLSLANPIIASSSGLTGTVKGVKRCEEAGAGAVVLKSLFEEQIEAEVDDHEQNVDVSVHPEAEEYLQQMGRHLGPQAYLDLIGESKQQTNIPIIASVNCVSNKWWCNYAKQIEEAGADAIELNISLMPREAGDDATQIEKRVVRLVDKVRQCVSIPIAAKIGPYFTALPALATNLRKAGAGALVLFNRFYQLDIDVSAMELRPGYQFSHPTEIYQTIRWISVLRDRVGCQLSASTGVHSATDALKLILAGADSVQMCSALYKHGVDIMGKVNRDIETWMGDHGFETIDSFRGKLAQSESKNPEAYERLQYIKALTGLT